MPELGPSHRAGTRLSCLEAHLPFIIALPTLIDTEQQKLPGRRFFFGRSTIFSNVRRIDNFRS